jgi:hypothetical protein
MKLTKQQVSDAKKVYKALLEDIDKDQKIELGRLNKAYELTLELKDDENLKKYQTTVDTCLCPDKGYRGQKFYCKHQMEYWMLNPAEFFQKRYEETLW